MCTGYSEDLITAHVQDPKSMHGVINILMYRNFQVTLGLQLQKKQPVVFACTTCFRCIFSERIIKADSKDPVTEYGHVPHGSENLIPVRVQDPQFPWDSHDLIAAHVQDSQFPWNNEDLTAAFELDPQIPKTNNGIINILKYRNFSSI